MRHVLLIALLLATAHAEPRRTTESVTLRKKPGEKEAALATLAAGTEVTVIAEHDRWLEVKVNGVTGYVTRTTVTVPAVDMPVTPGWSAKLTSNVLSADTKPAVTAPVDVVTAYTRAPRDLAIRIAAGIGYRSLGMDLTSNAEGGLTNYLVDADAAAVLIDADVVLPLGDFFVGADARTLASMSSPGIDYPGPTAPAGKIPFSTFAVDGGVRAGVHVRDAIDLAVHLGGHYDAFMTKQVDNAGMLPRERLLGATAGVRVDIVPPHSRFAAGLRLDVLAIGSRAQTPGLEDGTDSSAHALWGGLGVRYQLTPHVTPFAAYDFGRAWTSWTGPSVREPGVTDAHRTDTTQTIEIGVGAEL